MKGFGQFKYVIIVMLSFAQHAFAQSEPHYGTNCNECDIILYNTYITKAEQSILDGEYFQASLCYDTAFQFVGQAFALDIYNSSICDVLNREYSECDDKIKYLIGLGIDSTILENNPLLQDRYKRILQENNNVVCRYHRELKRISDSLGVMDQKFRGMRGYMEVHGDTVCFIDSLNTLKVLDLMKQHGWLSEFLVGACKFHYLPWELVIVHQGHDADCRIHDFGSAILDAIYNCKLETRRGLYLYATSQADNKWGITQGYGLVKFILETKERYDGYPAVLESTQGFLPINDAKLEKINAERKKLGLCTIEVSRLQSISDKQKLGFMFNTPETIGLTYDSKEEYLEKVKLLKK